MPCSKYIKMVLMRKTTLQMSPLHNLSPSEQIPPAAIPFSHNPLVKLAPCHLVSPLVTHNVPPRCWWITTCQPPSEPAVGVPLSSDALPYGRSIEALQRRCVVASEPDNVQRPAVHSLQRYCCCFHSTVQCWRMLRNFAIGAAVNKRHFHSVFR